MKGRGGTRLRHALAGGLSLLLGATACGSGEGAASPAPTTTATASAGAPAASREAARSRPDASDWLFDLVAGDAGLYLTSRTCPGEVRAGVCTVMSDPVVGVAFSEPFPLTLWRYAGGRWEHLGRPGITTHSDVEALPGGLLLVPHRHDPVDSGITGPLRVSLDAGRSWHDWPIPQEDHRCRTQVPSQGPCTVGVAGDYVVVASRGGWIRRSTRGGGWEDITPPQRARMSLNDLGGYGLLVLEGDTLVATANNPDDLPRGFFRVSKDLGSSWSSPHLNPGVHSLVDHVDGPALYASCYTRDAIRNGAHTAMSCGYYRSTDLLHWRKATTAEASLLDDAGSVPCRRQGSWQVGTVQVVRVGALVYGISERAYLGGDRSPQREPGLLGWHLVRTELERSADGCRTWWPVLRSQP